MFIIPILICRSKKLKKTYENKSYIILTPYDYWAGTAYYVTQLELQDYIKEVKENLESEGKDARELMVYEINPDFQLF